MKATAKDLRFRIKEILECIDRGEEVIITYRGNPRAKIIPINENQNNLDSSKPQTLFGIWKDNDNISNVNKYIRNLRKERF